MVSTRGHGLWWEGEGSMLMEVEPNTQAMRSSDKLQEPPGSEAGMKVLEADAVHEAFPLSAQATHVLWSTSTSGVLTLEHDLWRPCPLQGRGRC